eukprot:TRINITY_DN50084_c0_g2_i1.p1 TRINITY_DN50084_c0_g2~~TRINITY_DN50084_c0_g2_i1.p1  ORF type:complete len:232 (+),score=24.77 TRINITY_DN50084_c0_g2_i1:144-839(+)
MCIRDRVSTQSTWERDNSYLIKFTCGGLTGILTSTLTYPLDLIRTFLSIQTSTYKTAVLSESQGIFSGLRAIVRQKGILAIFRGMAATNVGIVPYIGLQMSIFEQTQRLFEGCEHLGFLRLLNLLNGAWSGFASAGLTYPLDVVRRKMQLRGIESSEPEYSSIFDAIKKMYRMNGIRSFFQGFWASQVKMASATALMFMANEELKRVLQVQTNRPADLCNNYRTEVFIPNS